MCGFINTGRSERGRNAESEVGVFGEGAKRGVSWQNRAFWGKAGLFFLVKSGFCVGMLNQNRGLSEGKANCAPFP